MDQENSLFSPSDGNLNEEIKLLKEKIIGQQKLVSLGMLCAGAAHEIKNPLNFIANFAQINNELFDELKENFLEKKSLDDIDELIQEIQLNNNKILEHARRVESIVVNMLAQARGSNQEKSLVDLSQLIEETINLSYHGMRALDSAFNVKFEKKLTSGLKINLFAEEFTRLLYNLLHNAYYATRQKKRLKGDAYQPIITIITIDHLSKIEMVIKDNGEGIKKDFLEKIFTPFFTTKSPADGSGLGLAISKNIVTEKLKGEIKVDSQEGEWTEFTIIWNK